jgi:hypothetical protein
MASPAPAQILWYLRPVIAAEQLLTEYRFPIAEASPCNTLVSSSHHALGLPPSVSAKIERAPSYAVLFSTDETCIPPIRRIERLCAHLIGEAFTLLRLKAPASEICRVSAPWCTFRGKATTGPSR